MRLRPLLLALLLSSTILAGCLSDGGEKKSTDGGDELLPPPVFSLDNLTLPTGQGARDWIADYVMTHPFRVGGQFESYMATARDSLVGLLEGFGHNVTRHDYDGGQNILAIQEGTTNPEDWVVLSAHYDTVGAGGIGPTVYGAWDDGAGVGILLELAETMIDWEFPFTIVYAFFDGEEKGLVGSGKFVETYFQDGIHDLVANINTDPPGLNWPCGDPAGDFPVKIIHNMAKVGDTAAEPTTRYQWLYHAVEHGLEAAGVPANTRDYTPGIPIAGVMNTGLTGTSDHARFDAVDVANVYLGGIPVTMVGNSPDDYYLAAMTYLLHTPLDTLEQMEARCVTGSLAGGLHTITTMFVHTLAYMAKNPAPEEAVHIVE